MRLRRLALCSWALCLPLLFGGCYERHERAVVVEDGGVSRFEGPWLVDQPTHATYEATRYDLLADGRFIEICSLSLGGHPVPVAFVERASDGRRCELTGPWSSLDERVLAVESFCDDSVQRTVVLDVVWDVDRPRSVTIQKVDGEEEGWVHPGFEWRWLPCAAGSGECDVCE